jgi:glycerol-1-phosphate dehydrogenase [NAD(P)+]
LPRKVEIPTYLMNECGAINRLSQSDIYRLLEKRKVAVICGNGHSKKISNELIKKIIFGVYEVKILYCKDNTMESVEMLDKEILKHSPDIIIGIGGGKILDVSKWLGTRFIIPFILFPTTISSDAICSPIAVLRRNSTQSISVKVNMPNAIVIDLDILVSSPRRLILAGIGDLLSNKTALFDWKLAHQAIKEEWNPIASIVAHQAVESFLAKINTHGSSQTGFIEAATNSLIMCGIAMSIAGSSRPCSGSEHLISHALDHYCGAKALHGEQVAIGLLIAEYLQGKHHSEESLKPYFHLLGIPTDYRELGYTREEMHFAFQKAPTLRERYTILNEYKLCDKQIDLILDEVFHV